MRSFDKDDKNTFWIQGERYEITPKIRLEWTMAAIGSLIESAAKKALKRRRQP